MATHTRLIPIERERIMVLLSQGHKPSDMATKMERYRSVITRELKRNSSPDGSYSAHIAQHSAVVSASKSHNGYQKLTTPPSCKSFNPANPDSDQTPPLTL